MIASKAKRCYLPLTYCKSCCHS